MIKVKLRRASPAIGFDLLGYYLRVSRLFVLRMCMRLAI